MSGLVIRDATERDIPEIIAMLADDDKGRLREDVSGSLDPGYAAAFAAITADPNQHILVAEQDGMIVGTFQLSFLPGLSHRGAWRGQIEAVRISREVRGLGLGREMMEWAIARCRERKCHMIQLTSHRSRNRAHAFYERIGFQPTHVGMKLYLGGIGV